MSAAGLLVACPCCKAMPGVGCKHLQTGAEFPPGHVNRHRAELPVWNRLSAAGQPLPGKMAKLPVVLLNGPPHVGKDTAGRAIAAAIGGVRIMQFSEPGKRATHALFDVPADAFEFAKDEPNPGFGGRSPREAYIEVMETCRRRFGAGFFGAVLTRRATELRAAGRADVLVITDSGLPEEADPLLRVVGLDTVLLIRVRAPGRHCSFQGDCRGFIELPGVLTAWLDNDGDPAAFRAAVAAVVGRWLACLRGQVE